jgi:alpha-ketoglutarate-dependent taurine dioxygenase
MPIEVEPITGSAGAGVCGVDLADVSIGPAEELRKVWLDHKALVVHDQSISRTAPVGFGRRFGDLEVHPFTERDSEHPETGQRGIFTNRSFVSHIEGVDRNESDEIIGHLERQIMSPSGQCRIRWLKDTLVMWDNRAVQHAATNDVLPEHRRMERVIIVGDRPC